MTAVNFITIHNTGNFRTGATAQSHATYLRNGSGGSQASWHYTVDNNAIWQSFEDNRMCWHAGDGSGPGNGTSIGIEICVDFGFVPPPFTQNNVKPQSQATQAELAQATARHIKACENAAWLTAELLKRHRLSIDKVVQHKRWSAKNCPSEIRNGRWGVTWDSFINMVRANMGQTAAPPVTPPAPVPVPAPTPATPVQPAAPAQNTFFRVRRTWADAASQIGAFTVLSNAITAADRNKAAGFKVFDENGRVVYDPNSPK